MALGFVQSSHVGVLVEPAPDDARGVTADQGHSVDSSWFIIIDPEPMGARLATALRQRNRRVNLVSSVTDAQHLLEESSSKPAFVLLEMRVLEGLSLPFLPSLRLASPHTRFLIVTAYGSIAGAVQALRMGAENYCCKPLSADKLLDLLEHPSAQDGVPPPVHPSLHRAVWEYIQFVLCEEGTTAGAARRLGILPRSLRRMLQKSPPAR
jgi:two-component system, response regulator RegA